LNAPQVDTGRRRFLTRLFSAEQKEADSVLLPVPAVNFRGTGVYWALAGDRPGNVFLAGDDGAMLHYDGEQWSAEHSGSERNIHALCLTDDGVYSVGWFGQICERKSDSWKAVQGGESSAERIDLPLFDIAAAPGCAPWAVGDQGRVTRRNGGAWEELDTGSNVNLRCVLPLGEDRVLAGGLGGTLLDFNDGKWRQVETNSGCALVSIAQLGEDSFVVVGGEYSVAEGEFVGRIFLYADGDLSEVETGLQLPRLRKARREVSGLLIVGDGGAAYRWTEKGVVKLPGRARYDLHDVLSFATGEALICGDGETLLEERKGVAPPELAAPQGGRWEQLAKGLTQRTLRCLCEVDEGHIVAAGDGGVLLHWRDGEIQEKKIPGGLTVHALWRSSPRSVYAACDQASVAHYDGESWQIIHSGTQDLPLLAIVGFGPHDIFAVGDSGLVLRYDGLMWRQLETGVRQELYGLWGEDSSHLLAVGGGGLVMRFDGDKWKSFVSGTHQDLYAVYGSGLQKLYLAGLGGTLIRFENNRWHREFTGVRHDLHALAGNNRGQFFASGSNGSVLINRDGDWESEETGVTTTLQAMLCADGTVYAAGSLGTLLRREIE
jgi:hypothetical protein